MYIQKKKVAKILAGFTLLGILASVFAFGIFADDITGIPDNTVQISNLIPTTRWYKIPGITDWLAYTGRNIESESVYFRYYWRDSENQSNPIIQNNYTYYFDVNMRIGLNDASNYDLLNLWFTDSYDPNSTTEHKISIRGFSDFTLIYQPSHPLTHIQFIFRSDSTSDYSLFNRICLEWYGSGSSQYYITGNDIQRWYDVDGTIYDSVVMNSLNEIDSQLDTVNNNLVSIESSIDDMNTNVGNKLQQVQNKIDAQSQQQHQDAEDIKDDIEDLPQNISDYEKNEIQDEWDAIDNEFGGGGGEFSQWTADYEAAQIRENLSSLWNAISNTNKNYQITFPASGTVPILDRQLWTEQTVDLQPFASSTVGIILIIACNGVFAIIGVLGIVKWFRTFVVDLLDIDHDPDN